MLWQAFDHNAKVLALVALHLKKLESVSGDYSGICFQSAHQLVYIPETRTVHLSSMLFLFKLVTQILEIIISNT